ncbi:MAG: glutamate mutase L [Actinomycetes bacterium]
MTFPNAAATADVASSSADAAACIDVGSTWTKGVAVDLATGALLATASSPTTSDTDVLQGLDTVLAELAERSGCPTLTDRDPWVCSSAGGGLRLAVVGYERAVTAEAGFRVALSAGGRVCHVSAGKLDPQSVEELRQASPDVILLVGGTDGGNADVLLHNADALARARLKVPVVLAGNADAAPEVEERLRRSRVKVTVTANVLPTIGSLEPRPAREAIREAFLQHVIGGKGLSRGKRFSSLVQAATPDAVLRGVELLADGVPARAGAVDGIDGAGDVLVVDVGGATTDVYSVITPEGEDAVLRREVVGPLWRARTVEGDLGMRWSAPGVVEAAASERLLGPGEEERLSAAAAIRAGDPSWLPQTDDERADEVRLAELAVTVALRRHARPTGPGSHGRDLRRTALVVGSGGVLRHGTDELRSLVLAPAVSDHAGGWKVPERARVTTDVRYVLAAAGLLAESHPVAAARLLHDQLVAPPLAHA